MKCELFANREAHMLSLQVDPAIEAALAAAAAHGIASPAPRVIARGSNTLVHLLPHPLVARVATGTGRVRSGSAWLERELAVSRWLMEQRAPALAPSSMVPPVVHHSDEIAITFWPFVELCDEPVDPASAARELHRCHEGLEGFTGSLEPLAIVRETEALLSHPLVTAVHDGERLSLLRHVAAGITRTLDDRQPPLRPVHGDAHVGNCWRTHDGILWGDWEDVDLAPAEWDLACLLAPARLEEDMATVESVLAAWAAPVDQELLELLIDARLIQAAVWRAIVRGTPTLRAGTEERLRLRAG